MARIEPIGLDQASPYLAWAAAIGAAGCGRCAATA